jgi:signal transduction histidine kinase
MRNIRHTDLIHPDYVELVRNNHISRMKGNSVIEKYEVQGIRKNKTSFWFEVRTTVLEGNGHFVGTRNYLWDITERKVFEELLQKNNEEITRLSQHVESIREQEQKKFAANLHDDLGQLITAIKMDLSWIKSNAISEEAKIKQKANSGLQVVDQALSNIKNMTANLRPPVIDNLGLCEAIENLVHQFRERSQFTIELNLPGDTPSISPDISITVYRIVQEALTNVLKHAHASKVRINLSHEDCGLAISISDNGEGVELDKIDSKVSFGLIGIRERVLHRKGTFNIESKPGLGTKLEIQIPLVSSVRIIDA